MTETARIFYCYNQNVIVFLFLNHGITEITYYHSPKQIGQSALSREQYKNLLKEYIKDHTEFDPSENDYKYWLHKAQQWIAESDERNKATAKGLVKILTPLQKAGLIGPDHCLIL